MNSDDSDSDHPHERMRCTYRIIRDDPPNRKIMLTSAQMREKMEMKKLTMRREERTMWRPRNDSEEEYSTSYQGNESPPLISSFKKSNRRALPIRELTEMPWRNRRPRKIAILIRGPLCSGKSYISRCILERENFFGNNQVRRINGINGKRKPNEMVRDGPDLLFKELHEAIKEKVKFLIIEIKSRKNSVTETCLRLVKMHDYEIYGIDINVDMESRGFKAKLKETHWYSFESLTSKYLKEMKQWSLPYFVTMVNPVGILPNSYKIKCFLEYADDFLKTENYSPPGKCDEDFSIVTDTINSISSTKNIFDYFSILFEFSLDSEEALIEKISNYIVNMNQKPHQSVIELHLMKFPSYESGKVIEYDHKTKKIDDSKILEVNPQKIIDYNHSSSQYLMNIIVDVDIETAMDLRKSKLMQQNLEYYMQFAGDFENCGEVYPNNWKVLDVHRQPVHGKRKKRKNAKILKVIQQKSVKNVQKGVKRMKIDEKFRQTESLEDFQMDVNMEPETPYYIEEISRKTSILGRENSGTKDEVELIKAFYIRLDSIPEMSTILHLVAQVDHLKIIFNLSNGENSRYSTEENFIQIFVNDLPESQILKILGNQLIKCAVHWTYKNDAKPFTADDDDRKEELERIIFAIELGDDEGQKKFKNLFENIRETEVVGMFGEMIVNGTTEELNRIENLKKFLDRMMVDIENFGKRFKTGTTHGVF